MPIHTHTHSYHGIDANSQIVFGFNKDTLNWQTFSYTPLLTSLKLHLFVYLFVFRNTQSWPPRLFPLFSSLFLLHPVLSHLIFGPRIFPPFSAPLNPDRRLHYTGREEIAPQLHDQPCITIFEKQFSKYDKKMLCLGLWQKYQGLKSSHHNLTSIRTCLIISEPGKICC